MTGELVQSPVHPDWLIPKGWEQILGLHMDYRLGESVLHLWRVQFNQHAGTAAASTRSCGRTRRGSRGCRTGR